MRPLGDGDMQQTPEVLRQSATQLLELARLRPRGDRELRDLADGMLKLAERLARAQPKPAKPQ